MSTQLQLFIAVLMVLPTVLMIRGALIRARKCSKSRTSPFPSPSPFPSLGLAGILGYARLHCRSATRGRERVNVGHPHQPRGKIPMFRGPRSLAALAAFFFDSALAVDAKSGMVFVNIKENVKNSGAADAYSFQANAKSADETFNAANPTPDSGVWHSSSVNNQPNGGGDAILSIYSNAKGLLKNNLNNYCLTLSVL
jgi:hypothetical protein